MLNPLLFKKVIVTIRQELHRVVVSSNRRVLLEMPITAFFQLHKKVENSAQELDIQLNQKQNTITVEKHYTFALPTKYSITDLSNTNLQIVLKRYKEVLETIFTISDTFSEISFSIK